MGQSHIAIPLCGVAIVAVVSPLYAICTEQARFVRQEIDRGESPKRVRERSLVA